MHQILLIVQPALRALLVPLQAFQSGSSHCNSLRHNGTPLPHAVGITYVTSGTSAHSFRSQWTVGVAQGRGGGPSTNTIAAGHSWARPKIIAGSAGHHCCRVPLILVCRLSSGLRGPRPCCWRPCEAPPSIIINMLYLFSVAPSQCLSDWMTSECTVGTRGGGRGEGAGGGG